MTDRFANAGQYGGRRHKGTRVATIWAQYGDGDITIAPVFDTMHAVERADLLQDAIFILQEEYEIAIEEMRTRGTKAR
jgi:hypothetical protein